MPPGAPLHLVGNQRAAESNLGFFLWPDHRARLRFSRSTISSAIANEFVRRTQTPEVWATFRVAAIVAAVLFGAAQFPLLRKYWHEPAPGEAPEPPEPGF